MKSARHQLLLLGLICQGLSWDDYVLPLGYALLWLLLLRLPARFLRFGPGAEALALLAGCAGGFFLAEAFGKSIHFFLGHGLALLQLVRLPRPLTPREKLFSILIALFHLGVACTVILDMRFILIFLAAVWLAPRALAEMEAGAFLMSGETFPGPNAYARPPVGWRAYALIVGLTVMIFLCFPRAYLGGPFRAHLGRLPDQGTLLETVLDPARSGAAQSRRILLQIQGEKLGYLRCYALVDFDGERWLADHRAGWRRAPAGGNLARGLARRVRVKHPTFLGRVLPTDGRVMELRGTFFRRPFENSHGLIEAEWVWNRANNYYEYWMDPVPRPEPLIAAKVRQFTAHPAVDAAVRAWLEGVVVGATNQVEQARRLETYLRRNFTYVLGAPELSRINTLEDFLLNQKQGHCERFASALALLLRMQGIPSRVMIGYVPSSRNWISGWYDIRFCDAHAWTEAWFGERGWIQLDATPRATQPPPGRNFADLFEALDFAWYAHVVNLDAPTQNALLAETLQRLAHLPAWLRQRVWPILGLAAGPLLLLAWRYWCRTKRGAPKPAQRKRQAQYLAGHYYRQMLGALARRGFHRQETQTPWEFVAELEKAPPPVLAEVRLITGCFCRTYYGQHVPSAEEQAQLAGALARVKQVNA